MRLYILRHGEAQQQANSDAERQLTSYGRKQVRAQAQVFDGELSSVQSVYVSPYARAQQTADELISGLSAASNLKRFEATWLTPDTAIENAVQALEQLSGQSVLLVSHQPLVSYLISFLSDAPIWQVSMDTASLACLEFDLVAKGLAELKSITPALVPR